MCDRIGRKPNLTPFPCSRQRPVLDTWFYPMALGKELPTLPLWLDVDLGVFLPLATSYEETCRLLHIR